MIAIINGCGANLASVQFALERLGKKSVVTSDAAIINAASHVILPGVGTAQHAMRQLQQLNLVTVIQELQQPVLGFCLGMQLLYQHSAEGDVDCLGIVPGNIIRLPAQAQLTLPHMGWNTTHILRQHSALFTGINDASYFYYVHSFAAEINEYTLATAEHGINFTAVTQYKNFYGAQFHPERSGVVGATLLQNFLALR